MRALDECYAAEVLRPDGSFRIDTIDAQDVMVWVTQGARADRSTEHLVDGDKGIAMFRRLLGEQIALVEAGDDPINVFREARGPIALPMEHSERGLGGSAGNPAGQFIRTHAKFSHRITAAIRLIDQKLGLTGRERVLA